MNISCTQCGASLPVDPLKDRIVCEACGATSFVPVELFQSMRAHVTDMRAAWADELENRLFEVLNERATSSHWSLLSGIVLFGACAFFWLIALLAGFAGHVAPAISWAIVLATLASFALIARGFAHAIQIPPITRVIESGIGACASCGGPMRFRDDRSNAQCAYCGAVAVPEAALRRRMIAGALARVESASLAREGAERSNQVSIRRSGPMLLAIGFVCAIAIIAVIASAALTVGDPHPRSLAFELTALAGGLALIGSATALAIRRTLGNQAEFEARIGRRLHLPARARTRARSQAR